MCGNHLLKLLNTFIFKLCQFAEVVEKRAGLDLPTTFGWMGVTQHIANGKPRAVKLKQSALLWINKADLMTPPAAPATVSFAN
jgi:hypothetical protein